ncbi:MAG: FHA domain-containing protein [Acidobacteria bacterium]|nr:FHA domain-containing protein [Acidobacteriota bacterium]
MAVFTRERSASAHRRPAADLIAAVVDNMRENREELKYSVVVPSRYCVVLSPGEFARLEGLIPRLQAETSRALTEELARLNRPSWVERGVGALRGRGRPTLENPDTQWHVEFVPDLNGDLEQEGDLLVQSELCVPGEPDLGDSGRTRRITTVHVGATRAVREETSAAAVSPRSVQARLSYTDQSGTHHYDVVRDSTTIGRGGVIYPVDVRLSTSEDVSREHVRIRRDPATGRFYLIDLSSLGTTLNGRHVPRGFDEVDGARRENGAESELPMRARIGLAETVFIDFERVG